MTEKTYHPAASHFAFPYYFSGIEGGGELDTFPLEFPISFSTGLETFPLAFPISFSAGTGDGDGRGICFGDLVIYIPPEVSAAFKYKYDLALYYGDLQNTYVEGRCSRWDVQDYNIIVGTWIKKDDLQNIKNNIRPGAIKELKRVISAPKFYDSSWHGYNTIRVLPTPSSSEMNNSTLRKMRRATIGYVRNIVEHPIENSNWIELKLEVAISSNQAL